MLRIFCLVCDWALPHQGLVDLYGRFSRCPRCGGCTDGLALRRAAGK